MAAKVTGSNDETECSQHEHVVNRWLVDYYSFLALNFFQNERNDDFCAVRNILDSVLARPLESTDDMPIKIRVLQFLSRINEGEKLDLLFESDQSLSPLESALVLLENMNEEFRIPQQDFESACTSLKEMIVVTFIKKGEFDQAKEVLNKHFPKAKGGKRAVFMGLICRKGKTHEVIKQMSFQSFKEEMLAFCQGLCTFSIPFLYKAAKTLVDKRLVEQVDKTAEIDEQDEPGLSSTPQMITIQFRPCTHSIIQRARLQAAYKALAAGLDEKTFAELEQEVETEGQKREDLCPHHSSNGNGDANLNSEQEKLFQRNSCSPMEASPADQPPQTDAGPQAQARSVSKALYTVARLVVEPDSQPSSQCTPAPEELESEVGTEKPPQTLVVSSEKGFKDVECPVADREIATPTRKRPRRTTRTVSKASTSVAELFTDFEEDSPDPVTNGKMQCEDLDDQSNISLRRNSSKTTQSSSSESEEDTQLSSSFQTPMQRPHKSPSSGPTTNVSVDLEDICIRDTSSDGSPKRSLRHPVPQKSSTPHKDSAQGEDPSHSKWKMLYNNAKESKSTWSDEESYFGSKRNTGSNESTVSNSGHKKRRWTDSETQKLRDGVKKFGEGNWSKIKAYYSFKDRTNVNLKDRWRTLKKANMV
ncbi:telomeric repeat binding factor a [Leuresthes tenuis]|uniref:telomeric repeat binding factor a n=1 Tax=Leuresthes tenuis TaxID=355514 RepID=UPI003B5061BD